MKYLFLSILIFLLGLVGFFDGLRDFSKRLTLPISLGLREQAMFLKSTGNFFSKLNNLRKENLQLLEEIRFLKEVQIRYADLERENSLLRNQLHLTDKTKNYTYVFAQVMGNPNDLSGGSFVITAGSVQRINVGNNVVIGDSLVGFVSEVGPNLSLVSSVMSPQFKATVSSNRGVEGLAEGFLGTGIKVTKLLSDDMVEVNDIFYTTGRDGKFVPGLLVGTITNVKEKTFSPLAEVDIKPNFSYDNLSKVFVIVN